MIPVTEPQTPQIRKINLKRKFQRRDSLYQHLLNRCNPRDGVCTLSMVKGDALAFSLGSEKIGKGITFYPALPESMASG